MQWPPTLHYDRAGALVLGGILQPVFRHTLVSNGREHPYWGDGDENGRSRWQWLRDTNNVFAFRLAPGETLPAWPTPFPASGALQGATAVRPTNDGRVIVRASLSGANWTDWYDERGRPRQPTRQLRSGYLVYSADGRSELVNTPNLPVGVGTTGGSDISEDGRRFAWVLSRNLPRGIRPANEAWDHRHTLQVFENGELIFERPTSELAANAATIRASLEGAPIMPTTSLEGRLTAEGPEEGLRSSP
jgi:hypothetical protein